MLNQTLKINDLFINDINLCKSRNIYIIDNTEIEEYIITSNVTVDYGVGKTLIFSAD